jgi:hypothetical protein
MPLASLHTTTRSSRVAHPRLIAFLTLGFLWCAPQPGQAEPDALALFKNYFVTGDYAVAGVGMRGTGVLDPATQVNWATATITMSGVPANADILAAFLYWAALETSPTPFSANGFFNGLPIVGKSLGPGGISGANGCWGSGGGSGTTSGASPLRVYRANVLAALPFPKDANGVPVGKRAANGSHVVKLRDSGGGGSQSPSSSNQKNLVEGASLVVVWRRPDYPLRGITIYDGAYTAHQDNNGVMNQVVKGFYQAADDDDSRMTHIVSNGDKNFADRLTVGGNVPAGVSPSNAFVGALGFAWDNVTFDVNLDANAASVATKVEAVQSSVDCLSWSAIVFSTKVQDRDWDGLLDVWETVGLRDLDNAGPMLVDLPGMGAHPDVQDIFIQVAYLKTSGQTTYGPDPPGATPPITAPKHSHLPSRPILDQIVALFDTAAPRRNPAGDPLEICTLPSPDCIDGPIRVHFDVGPDPEYAGEDLCNASEPCPYVPQSIALGGHYLLETDNRIKSTQFPLWPGTVGWKSGFIKIWDELLSDPNEPAFEPNRRHIFRRALFGHAMAIQDPAKPDGTPRSVSGVADAGNGGGDFMVTLGLWDNFTGTEFVQTSTTVHEIVHLLGIRHGGAAPTPTLPSLNCKPNYQSVSNYLFQILGLPGPDGPVIDLSRQVLRSLNENTLGESPLTDVNGGDMSYPTRWYVPLGQASTNLNVTVGTTPASKTCTGVPVPSNQQTMIRVSSTSATDPIDWNVDGSAAGGTIKQDVNYNKLPTQFDQTLNGYNDWLNLDLRQGASRRNRSPGEVVPGPGQLPIPIALSLEIDRDDVASGDPGFGDPGFGDPGFGDPGFGDPGFGDPGFGDPGFGDPGFGDPGFGDPGFGDPGFGDPGFGGDLDFERATNLGGSPYGLHVFAATNRAIILEWFAPTAGKVSKYRIWRAIGPITPQNQPQRIAEINGNLLTFSDTTSRNSVSYSYVVTAVVEGKNSGPSNIFFPARR